MIGGFSYILIVTFVSLFTFTLSDNWGDPRPEDFPKDIWIRWTPNSRLGDQIQLDCMRLIEHWPKSGPVKIESGPSFWQNDNCIIGLWVQNPRGGGFSAIEETWEKVHYTTAVAVDLLVGTVRAGWTVDFASGVQVSFFAGKMSELYPFDPTKSIGGNMIKFFAFKENTAYYPSFIPPIQPGAGISFDPVGVLGWGAQLVAADCESVISHFGIISWFVIRTGITLRKPWLETVGFCTLGVYRIDPRNQIPADTRYYERTPGLDIDIRLEATKLLRTIETQPTGGGYVNLHNGLQLCLFEITSVDPMRVCEKMDRMSLKDCLDNRAAAYRARANRGPAEASARTPAASPVLT